MLTSLLVAAALTGTKWVGHAKGPLIGANDLVSFADARYKVKEVARFWIDRPSEILGLRVALAGHPGNTTVHIWKDIDHEWPFYRFEEDATRPINLRVNRSDLNKWQEISFTKNPIALRNSGYVYVGIVYKPASPQLAVDEKLDRPADSRYEIFDTSDPHSEEVYFPRAKGDYAVAINVRALPERPRLFQDVTNRIGLGHAKGASIAWADVDGDGWEDLLLSGSRLYRNAKGKSFVDITRSSGLGTGGRFGIFADVDGDGDQDLFIGGDKDRVLLNDGHAHFRASSSDVSDGWYSRCASWIDYDHDGKVDLFVANGEDGVPTRNRLWRNLGGGAFGIAPVPEINGGGVAPAFTFSCAAADLDVDGNAELAVLGFRLLPDQLWWFTKSGAQDRAHSIGFDVGRSPSGALSGGNGTGIGIGDLNGDASPDMWVSNLMHPDWRGYEASLPSILFLSRKGNGYERVKAEARGVAFDEAPSDPTLGDFDNDGDLDVYTSSKYHRGDYYENSRGSFLEKTYESGIRAERSESSAACDFDHDGRLDLCVETKDDAIKLYRNVSPARNWLEIQLGGQDIGASVFVTAAGRKLLRQVIAGKGLGSQDSSVLHFGLGTAKKVEGIDVIWSGGSRQHFSSITTDCRIFLRPTRSLLRAN